MSAITKQKSILFRIWTFPGYCETFLLSQVAIAIKSGYRVKILVENLQNLDRGVHKEIVEQYDLREKIIVEDYNIPDTKIIRFLNATRIFMKFVAYSGFRRFLEKSDGTIIKKIYQFNFLKKLNDYDIVHVQYGTNVKPLDVLKEGGVLKSKLVVSFHGHDLYFPINGQIPNNGYYDRTFKHSDLLVVNTFYLRSILVGLGASEDKIKTIPVSVDTDFFWPEKEKKRNDRIKVITVGRLEIFKGQNFGIECIARLIDEGYSIDYLLIGDGTQRSSLANLIEEKNIANYVTLLGPKTQEEIRLYLQEQDIFLMTSVTDPSYGVESQGLVTAEAQATGLPVIAFDSGGVRYTLKNGETGYLVPEKDVDAMVSRIRRLIIDSELRKQMGQNAVKFVKDNFSQKTVREQWSAVYGVL